MGIKKIFSNKIDSIKKEIEKIQQIELEKKKKDIEIIQKQIELQESQLNYVKLDIQKQIETFRLDPKYSRTTDQEMTESRDKLYQEQMNTDEFGKDIDPLHLSRDLQIDEILQNDIDNKNLKSTDSEFQQIIQEITNLFIPQKITNEEHLQSQITIFLQARYPEKIVEREIQTSKGDKLDIVIDKKYVLEVKVPHDKTALRNLSAQLEEYQEEYSNICAVIFNDENLYLSETIREYATKYHEKFDIPTIIISGKKRN